MTCSWDGAEGAWGIASDVLQGIGGGAAQWYKIRCDTEISGGFIATFDKTGDYGAFVFCSDDSYNGYMFCWTGTEVSLASLVAGTPTNLIVLPCTETGNATVTVMAWPQQHTSVDTVDDILCALWFDDKLLLSYTVSYDDTKGEKIGFATYQSETATFDNLRIPQFHQIIEWTSVDPGESVSAGLSRIVAHARVRVQARYNGSVKIWRNNTTVSDWTVQDWRLLRTEEQQQFYWPTHLRLSGAMHEADVFRDGVQGHIFAKGQDPNVLTEEMTNEVAVIMHRGAEEGAHVMTLTMPPNPLLEPEDVITYDDTEWRVSSINYRVAWQEGSQGGAPILSSQILLRECIAEGEGEA